MGYYNGNAHAPDAALHIAVLPSLAAGHQAQFLELSKRLALLGCRVSFLSTPSNLQLILSSPVLPSDLHLVPLSPSPAAAASSPNAAYDSLSAPLAAFLSSSTPPVDWLLCDYAPYWAPTIARSLNVRSAFVAIFSTASMAFLGPPQDLMQNKKWPVKVQADGLTVVPEWVPFHTPIAFKPCEVPRLPRNMKKEDSDEGTYAPIAVTDFYRFGVTIRDCDAFSIRSCSDIEQPEWFDLLRHLFKKPVLPLGLFPPPPPPIMTDHDDKWAPAFEWLDKQTSTSVVYVAHGIDVKLTDEEVRKIAFGLEQSGLPFIWALRWAAEEEPLPLPEGFEERTKDRGHICRGWVPQVRILAHPAVGGFLTNCGWSSMAEALQFGVPLILLSMIRDQKTNGKVFAAKGVGKEVPREGPDRTFDAYGIAETVRVVVVGDEGERFRAKARELRDVFGDAKVQRSYVKKFVEYMKENKPVRS